MTLMAIYYLPVFGAFFFLRAGKVAENPASMIWYLLYPFRGTTEPPELDPKHPIRRSFTRYGTYAAKNPIFILLISVVVASILIYPIPFLYTNTFANGASNLPHHVWTSAQPYDGDSNILPDVVMRSFWVHGSYMKALKSDVLQTALEIQNEVLGPTIDFDPRQASNQVHISLDPLTPDLTANIRDSFHASNGLSNSSWFFHSPLQYWGCSMERIEMDQDIIQTVNDGSSKSTSVNVTLRHSIVFSGKRFEDRRLVAADALVVTLVHMLDSPVGRQWERRLQDISRKGSDKWDIIPPDPKSHASSLYEFRFQPLSFTDDLILVVAYSAAVIWFFRNLRQMQALKSRIGLIFATLAQVAVSIISSFTICAVLKIDLSKIPRAYYPSVVLFLSCQNICTLINTVILTPSDRPTFYRIGEALGEKGHVSLASLAQNTAFTWILSTGAAPPVKAFAWFMILAIILDYFYLLTFFTAVLSIDVRRTELSDSLNRISTEKDRFSPDIQPRKTWIDFLWAGKGLMSARVAGTIVVIGSVLIAQWHFYDNDTMIGAAWRFFRSIISENRSSPPSTASLLSVDIHQARTPTAWLRLQDHKTAHEVIQVIKPHADRYIARVYDPIIFVFRGSDRTPNQSGVRPFLPAFYDFARNQGGTFSVFVVILSAAVWLLMHYLLWDDSPEAEYKEERPDDEPLLSVKTLSHGHYLDIALVEASNDGTVVTVGLDRCIRVWDMQKGGLSYIVHDPESNNDPFPVLALAIDRDSNWLAILSAKNQVILWNIPERRWGSVMSVDVRGRTPASFCFGYDKTELIDPVIVTRHNGMMTELHMEANESTDLRICHSPLVCVRPHFEKPTTQNENPPLRILTSSRKGCVHVASQLPTGWLSEGLELREMEGDREVRSILPLPALSSFLAIREHTIDLIDIVTHNITHTFLTKPMKPDTLRCFHSTRRRPQCGSVGLGSLALAYTCAETGACILQSYLPQRDGDTICFRDPYMPGSKTCCLWRETVEHNFVIENPGEWRTLQIGYIIGVRKRESPNESQETTSIIPASSGSGLRRRGGFQQRPFSPSANKPQEADEDVWEAWSISARGERSTAPLSSGQYGSEHLLVSELGPMERVGKRTIAVALGNVVKVVTVGHERFDDFQDDDDAAFVGMAATTRKKKHTTPLRKRP